VPRCRAFAGTAGTGLPDGRETAVVGFRWLAISGRTTEALTREAVKVPTDQGVEQAGVVRRHKCVVARALVPRVARADAVVHELIDDLPSALSAETSTVVALALNRQHFTGGIQADPQIGGGAIARLGHDVGWWRNRVINRAGALPFHMHSGPRSVQIGPRAHVSPCANRLARWSTQSRLGADLGGTGDLAGSYRSE
jgi:hypothetical protein